MFAYVEGPFSFWQVLLLSFGFGLLSGLWYECLRIVRTAVKMVYTPKKRIGRILLFSFDLGLDLVYFLVLAVAAVLFLYVCNRGQLRLSVLLTAGFGLYVYFITLGRMIRRIHTLLLRWSYRLICFIYRHTLGYLFCFLRWVYQRTLGILVHLVWAWLAQRASDFLCYRAKRRLDRLIQACENGLSEYDDYISIG